MKCGEVDWILHRSICIHEIGHAVMYEICGWRVNRIVIDLHSGGVCEAELKPGRHIIHRNTKALTSYAGVAFELIFGANRGTIDETSLLGGYNKDYDDVPDPDTHEFTILLNDLKQIVDSLNPEAIRSLAEGLCNTPFRSGRQIMSRRRFRKIIRDSGGLRKSHPYFSSGNTASRTFTS